MRTNLKNNISEKQKYDFEKYVYLKLNDNYANSFLTTNHGEIFYLEWKKQQRPEYVGVEKTKFFLSKELKEYVRQGILVIKQESKEIVDKVIKPKKEVVNKAIEPKKEVVNKIIEPKKEIVNEIIEPIINDEILE